MSTASVALSAAEAASLPATMTALVKDKAGPGAVLQTIPVPTVGAHDILVRVDAASICGTDLHIYNWDAWAQQHIQPPIVFGHEFCGTVVRAGSEVTDVHVGDFLAAESHITCGECHECRAGRRHACRQAQIIGVHVPGAFAQYVAIPAENAWPASPSLSRDIATIEEPMGNAVHTVASTPIVGANVGIFGLGPLGLFAIRIAQVYGAARIWGVELSEFRAQLGRRMGAERVLNPLVEDVPAVLLEETGGEGLDVALEMSGAGPALAQALAGVRHGGTVALLGLPSKPMELNLADDVIFKGLTLLGIVGRRIPETWHQTRGLLEAGVDMSPVITDRMPLTEFRRAFELLAGGRSGKIVLYPNQEGGTGL